MDNLMELWKPAGPLISSNPHEALTIVTGECARAYNLPMNEHTVNQWKENLDEPLPGREPEAKVVRRTIAFAHNPETPWIAVSDYLKTDGPATFDYLLTFA